MSGSILATLVSAVTFVSVPAAVFAPGGNLTYVQVVLGLALGKVAVAMLLARAYFDSHGVNTTYAYIGARLDRTSGEFSLVLGLVLTLINSGIKLLTASLVLDVITGWGLPGCALFVVAISVLWCVLAGIKTVIWTDFLLFVLFVLGAGFALGYMTFSLERTLPDTLLWLDEQAKLVLFDFSADPTVRYTIWSGVLGAIALSVAQGSTQGTWQRIKACRSATEAKKAYNYAALFYLMHLLVLGVGLALAAFYGERGLPSDIAAQLADSPDRIFPYFIVTELPVGISGLCIAAIFAAAISTLDSAWTEASDLSVNHVYERLRRGASETHYLRASRWLLVLWGGVFYGAALFFSAYSAEGLLDLTFKLPNYVLGGILGSVVLARFGIGRWWTFLLGFAVACLLVVYLAGAGVAFFFWCPVAGAAMVTVVWLVEHMLFGARPEWSGVASG